MASLTVPVKVCTLAAKDAGISAAPNKMLLSETANRLVSLMNFSFVKIAFRPLDVSVQNTIALQPKNNLLAHQVAL
jgi:hypothetical protein